MNQIKILKNPAQKYWNKIVEHVFAQEGWINSVHDYKMFSRGFSKENFTLLTAVDSKTDNFIGSVCVGTYTKPEPLSGIGMYVVKKEFHGKGIGSRLFAEAVKLSAPRKFLYGVDDLMPKYRDRYGFDKMLDWYLLKAESKACNVKPLQLDYDPSLHIKSPEECGWNEIAKYYRQFLSQLDGSQLIKALLCEPQSKCAVAVTGNNKIVAVARVRETFGKELFIGPLLADNSIAASTVLRHVLLRIPNLQDFDMIKLEFPNVNSDALEFMRKMTDDKYNVCTLRSYPQFTHEAFELPVGRIYAVSQGDISIV